METGNEANKVILQGFSWLASRIHELKFFLRPEKGYSSVAEISAFDEHFDKHFMLELKDISTQTKIHTHFFSRGLALFFDCFSIDLSIWF